MSGATVNFLPVMCGSTHSPPPESHFLKSPKVNLLTTLRMQTDNKKSDVIISRGLKKKPCPPPLCLVEILEVNFYRVACWEKVLAGDGCQKSPRGR